MPFLLRELGWGEKSTDQTRKALLVAAWLGLVSGWLEAGQHWIFRLNPSILTLHKVSAHIFWIAPLLNLLLYVSLACTILVLAGILRKWPAEYLTWLACTWVAVYSLLTLTRKMDHVGGAMLALGVAVAVLRGMHGRSPWLFLRRSMIILLVCAIFSAVGLTASDYLRERRLASELPSALKKLPNVLLIILDTVRADHLSLYGYTRQTTPNLDRWAQRGTVFENAWSTTSWTLPTHASILTGRPAYEHGAEHGSGLDSRYPVLPEFLQAQGYVTGAFIANDIWLSPEYGFERGFLRFEVYTLFSLAARTALGRKIHSFLTVDLRLRTPVRKDAAKIGADFLAWIDRYPDRPFFAFLNYFDSHTPYRPPPPYDTKFTGEPPLNMPPQEAKFQRLTNEYDGLLAYLDHELGRLFAALERRGLADNTIVLVTSDHGEALGEHSLAEHGGTLYRELLAVPLILVAPGRVPSARRVEPPVSVQHIPATIVHLLGLSDGSPFPGPSMTQALSGNAIHSSELPEIPLLAELNGVKREPKMKSLITSNWQYIWNVPDGKEELYDLKKDPQELNNLAETPVGEPVVDDFRKHLRALFPDLPLPQPGRSPGT